MSYSLADFLIELPVNPEQAWEKFAQLPAEVQDVFDDPSRQALNELVANEPAANFIIKTPSNGDPSNFDCFYIVTGTVEGTEALDRTITINEQPIQLKKVSDIPPEPSPISATITATVKREEEDE